MQNMQNVSTRVADTMQDLLEALMSLLCFMLVFFMKGLIQACCNQQEFVH